MVFVEMFLVFHLAFPAMFSCFGTFYGLNDGQKVAFIGVYRGFAELLIYLVVSYRVCIVAF